MKVLISQILVCLPLFISMAQASYPLQDPCQNLGTSIVVLADSHRLHVCKNGKSLVDYRVSLGRGGVGKSNSGDLKTPLGAYPLGRPRPSNEFHMFIPVGYPTKAQKKQGYTGGDIGIHGPARNFSGIGGGILSGYVDWTQGCLAVSDDSYIEVISEWVVSEKPKLIHILNQ